ncbi:MAG: lamin tail domain-containing protein, partial [Candidatus Pacebacteria bacterium]|nr:lamin tail domain-containing protein [Candidatus Paceibacterota bacterium]
MFKSTHFSLLLIAFIVLMLPPFHALAAGPVIINEIMYDLKGTDSGHEWVEIKNISDQPVDLKNWRFFDGSNH